MSSKHLHRKLNILDYCRPLYGLHKLAVLSPRSVASAAKNIYELRCESRRYRKRRTNNELSTVGRRHTSAMHQCHRSLFVASATSVFVLSQSRLWLIAFSRPTAESRLRNAKIKWNNLQFMYLMTRTWLGRWSILSYTWHSVSKTKIDWLIDWVRFNVPPNTL